MSLLFISAPKSIIPTTVTLHLPTHTPQLWLWLCVSRNSWPRLCVSQTGLGLCVCPVVDRLDFVLSIWFFWDQDSLPACSLFLPWPHLALLLSQEHLHLLWFWPTCFLLWPAHQPSMWPFFIITSLLTPLFLHNSASSSSDLPAFYFDPLINSSMWRLLLSLLFRLRYFLATQHVFLKNDGQESTVAR